MNETVCYGILKTLQVHNICFWFIKLFDKLIFIVLKEALKVPVVMFPQPYRKSTYTYRLIAYVGRDYKYAEGKIAQ